MMPRQPVSNIEVEGADKRTRWSQAPLRSEANTSYQKSPPHRQQKYEKRCLLRWGSVGSLLRPSDKLGSEVDMRHVSSMERRGFLAR